MFKWTWCHIWISYTLPIYAIQSNVLRMNAIKFFNILRIIYKPFNWNTVSYIHDSLCYKKCPNIFWQISDSRWHAWWKKVVAYVKMKPPIFYLGAQKPLMSRRSMQGAEKCTNFGWIQNTKMHMKKCNIKRNLWD